MAGTTVERDTRRQPVLLSVVCWLTPLAVGLLGVVLLRLRFEAIDDSDLDTGGRFFLLGASLVLPLTCYAASAIAVLLTWPRQVASRCLWFAIALASGLAVAGWLLVFGRG
jgi:hypothetical protein